MRKKYLNIPVRRLEHELHTTQPKPNIMKTEKTNQKDTGVKDPKQQKPTQQHSEKKADKGKKSSYDDDDDLEETEELDEDVDATDDYEEEDDETSDYEDTDDLDEEDGQVEKKGKQSKTPETNKSTAGKGTSKGGKK